MSGIRVEASVDIARAAEEVFAYIANFENNPEWQKGMVEARFTSEGPLAVGSTYSQTARFLGKRIDSEFEVVELEDGARIKITTVSGSFPITVTRAVEPVDDGCRVTAIVEGDASGFFRIAAPLMRWMVGRSVGADYERLRDILETK